MAPLTDDSKKKVVKAKDGVKDSSKKEKKEKDTSKPKKEKDSSTKDKKDKKEKDVAKEKKPKDDKSSSKKACIPGPLTYVISSCSAAVLSMRAAFLPVSRTHKFCRNW